MREKKPIDKDIPITSRNGDRKNHIIYQSNKWTFYKQKETEPVQPVGMDIYQISTEKAKFS